MRNMSWGSDAGTGDLGSMPCDWSAVMFGINGRYSSEAFTDGCLKFMPSHGRAGRAVFRRGSAVACTGL